MGARNAANDRLCLSDAFEPVRKSIGVDSLDISSSATGGPPVKVTRAINDRISVGVTTGARPQDNGVSVNIDVRPREAPPCDLLAWGYDTWIA
jgi:autotransporter translocation and assembly factor TamB